MHGDELIKKMVEEVLYQHMDNADAGINVQVEKGFVNIFGIVDVLSEKYQAQKLVQGVPGVKGVDNSLTISTDGKIEDDDIKSSIEDLLGRHPRLKEKGIGSSCHRGNVHLHGKVRTLAESDEAEEIARKVMGVKEVINDLKVAEISKGLQMMHL